jgi:hypothetical protein
MFLGDRSAQVEWWWEIDSGVLSLLTPCYLAAHAACKDGVLSIGQRRRPVVPGVRTACARGATGGYYQRWSNTE